jgi:penicillin amidase
MRRFVRRVLLLVPIAVAFALAGAYVYLRQSLPLLNGTVSVPGLSAPIDIVRDADAIPHIFASTTFDGLFGLGYVHAQDRLWQMEFQRRIGNGRLSEIFGAATIPQDRFLRTVGFARAARADWESLPEWAKDQVIAYTNGINAFIATHHGSALPPEFTLLRFEPEPFTGADVIVWGKMMAWDLSANYSFELLRRDLVEAVGADRMHALMPLRARDPLTILNAAAVANLSNPAGRAASDVNPARGLPASWLNAFSAGVSRGNSQVAGFLLGSATTEALGSNNWVVDGSMTASGKPMLANDPHLSAKVPSTWYLAHVSGGDLDIIGATLPGSPVVALGRNRFIAWGATNVAADVEDLYRERLDAAGRTAEFRGTNEPLTVLPETILVRGGSPVRLAVRLSRHGPLVSDAINANNLESRVIPRPAPLEPLAFRWTALDPDDTTLLAFLQLNQARNWDDFTSALSGFVTPSQNFVYADVDGHIGYYAPGRIPIRAHADGSTVAEGWTGEAEWTGWVPFDQLPHAFDPAEHFIVTANNRPAPPDYPFNLGVEWPEPYRARRLTDLLKDRTRLTPADFVRIQADTLSLHAKTLLPALLAHAHPADAADRRAVDLLRAWDCDMKEASAAAAIFEAWFLKLAPAFLGRALPHSVMENYNGRFTYVTRFVMDQLDAHVPEADTAVTRALHDGVLDVMSRLGGDMSGWRWDAIHRATFPHQGLDAVALLRPLFSRSAPHGGDWSAVNVGSVAADALYEQHAVSGYREIIDLSPANDSRFADAVGESGHVFSPHYDDFLDDWQHTRHRRMRMTRQDVEAGAVGRLRLLPR